MRAGKRLFSGENNFIFYAYFRQVPSPAKEGLVQESPSGESVIARCSVLYMAAVILVMVQRWSKL